MNWLIWKQHGKQFLAYAVILALYAALAIPAGIHFRHVYDQALVTCRQTSTCAQLNSTLLQSSWESNLNPSLPGGGINIIVLLILALPFLLGVFVGVPLIAREYNSNTNLLIWTRSISRRKWLMMKLVWIIGSTAVFAGIFSLITTWFAHTGNALYLNRFDALKFGEQGLAPIGYAVFAVSLGIALGAWLKRTMLAVGITLAVLLGAQIVASGLVRPHYATPLSKDVWTAQLGPGVDTAQVTDAALIVDYKIVNREGAQLDWSHPPQQCVVPQSELVQTQSTETHHSVGIPGGDGSISSVNGGPVVKGSCLESAGYHYVIHYQPGNRYWAFQFIEFGLYLTLSLIAIAATYQLVLKRDA